MFGVRQRTPTTVDAAVAAALEIETYLRPRRTLNTVSIVEEQPGPSDLEDAIASVAYRRKCTSEDLMQNVLDRLEKLELQLQAKNGSSTASDNGGSRLRRKQHDRIVCWNCKEEGHLSRSCPLETNKLQGNETVGAIIRAVKGNSGCTLTVHVNGAPARCLVDTGAVATILSKRLWERLEKETRKPLTEVPVKDRLVGVQGTPFKLIGTSTVRLQFGGRSYTSRVLVAEAITADLILGRDFLEENQCTVELGEKNFLHLSHGGIVLPLGSGQEFQISHLPGRKHQNVDASSRLPCTQGGRKSHDDGAESDVNTVGTVSTKSPTLLRGRTSVELRQLQLNDPSVGVILLAKEDD